MNFLGRIIYNTSRRVAWLIAKWQLGQMYYRADPPGGGFQSPHAPYWED